MATINIKNKNIFLIIAALIIIAGIGYTVAIGDGPYTLHGHNINEIQGGTRYESDWFLVNNRESHTITHNLGCLPGTRLVYFSITSDGTTPQAVTPIDKHGDDWSGYLLDDVTTTDLKLKTADDDVHSYHVGDGSESWNSGYYKIILSC